MKRIAVIGGGISGLAAAYRLIELSNAGREQTHITVFEASSRPGGIIQTEERDGFLLERGPDSFISEKPEALALATRLNLNSRLIQTNPLYRRSFIIRNGRLRPVPAGFHLLAPTRLWPFITTDIFSLAGKMRMAADLLLPRGSNNDTGDESLASFVTRRLGREALERMAQPMVGGIYTADPEKLSLRATLPRFLEMERDHRSLILGMLRQGRRTDTALDGRSKTNGGGNGVSGARYSLFLSFDRGMQVLVDTLTKRILNTASATIRLQNEVSRINYNDRPQQRWSVSTATGETFACDAVCLAVPAYTAASILTQTETKLADHLRPLKYASSATINFAYRRGSIGHKLDGFGFVVPLIEKRSLIACTFSSIKFAGRAPQDHVLLRAFVGGALQPKMFELSEAEMVQRVQSDLEELLGIKGQPLFAEVARWKNSMPQYEVGHLERVRSIEKLLADLPGLTIAGNSYRGAGIPDCIRSGEEAAEKMILTPVSN